MFKILEICVLILYCFKMCQCEDEAWDSFQNSVIENNREELVISKITGEKILSLESNVTKWWSLSIGPTSYSIGLSEKGLEILVAVLNQNKTDFEIKNSLYNIGKKPSDVVIFHNRNQGNSELIIVVSFFNQSKISWLKISSNSSVTAQEFWSWQVEHPVVHVNLLKIGTRHILFYVTENNVANLYEFDIKNKPLSKWFFQKLSLESMPTSTAFNNFKNQYFLSIPQKNSVTVYKYSKTKFELFKKIRTPQITFITNFNIGFKTFFAVDGLNTGIYQFLENGLTKQKILNSNLEGVNFWLPVPLETIRDEVFILAQRVLDHSTHKTFEVNVITYSNGKFEEHEDIPCSFFEENTDTLSCLTETGILGSAYLVIDDKIGLVVPKSRNTFILFIIDTKIKENPHPREHEVINLIETRKKLEILLENANNTFEEITNLLNVPPEKPEKNRDQKDIVGEQQNLTPYLQEVEKIGSEVDKLFNKVDNLAIHEEKSEFETIFINGEAIFEDIVEVKEIDVENINEEPATLLLNDIINKEAINKQLKNKTFIDLEVENLNTKRGNGIHTDNIAFKDEPEIILNGTVIFNQFAMLEHVYITTKQINDIHFENEAVILGRKLEETLEFEQIKVEENLQASRMNNINLVPVSSAKNTKSKRNLNDDLEDSLFIPQNLTVTFINGENFTAFLHSLCMINKVCYIPGTVKIEKIHAEVVNTDTLNGLKYPEEYIFLNSESNGNIIGQKIFKTLIAEDVRSGGNINGVNTEDLVTLSTDQNIENLTLEHLELTEKLDVEGKLSGTDVDKFLSNPTLQEVNRIMSNVNFKNLDIKGNIIIQNNFEDKNFKALLQNLLYDDEDEATITTTKEFPKGVTVEKELQIKSNSINTVDLKTFVTKDTDQKLDINLLNGNTIIKNLFVNGSYDGKDIKTLDDSLVKLSGDQFVLSVLSFNDLEVNNLEIDKKLNDVKAEEFLYTTKPVELDKKIEFGHLIVENLTIQGDLNGEITGFDIQNIYERYLSKTKNQTINSTFNVNSSKVDNLILTKDNDKNVFQESTFLKYVKDLLNKGDLTVENLHVEDSINVNNINDQPTNVIYPINVLEMAKENGNKLIFENDIYLKQIELTNFSSVNWNDYIKQIVYKNQTDSNLIFTAPKKFLTGITVENLIETKKINNISIQHILTKEGDKIIRGPVQILGDLYVEDIEVKEEINDLPAKEFLKMFMVSKDGEYFIKRDMVFKRLSYIQSLNIEGNVNNKNIEEILKELVYKNKSVTFKNDVIFTKPVTISGNLAISDHFNNLNISDINSKIVLTTQDAAIEGLVSFSKSVEVEEKMIVDENLSAKFLTGFDIQDWYKKAIFVDKGLLKGHYKMDSVEINSKLTTDFINNLKMSRIIPLRSNQSIDHLHFGLLKFVKNIAVGNRVNKLFLPDEFQRTLMKDTDQEILPPTTFKNILVRQNLRTNILNNKASSKIVTTKTHQNLTAKYNFNSKIILDSHLNVHGLINKHDYEKWKENTLKLNSSKTSIITNEWNVLKNLTFEEDVYGYKNISDLDFPTIAKQIRDRKDLKYQLEHGIIKDHIGLCTSITYLYEEAKSQIYKFKYFEDFQTLSFNNTIKHVFKFDYKERQYLLINQDTCLSDLIVYNGAKFVPLILSVPTGLVEQMVPVIHKEKLFLVMKGDRLNHCNNIRGTNIWEFNGKLLELKFNMDNQDILQESRVPSTFYTYSEDGVIEYKIKHSEGPVKYRRWAVSFEDYVDFVPRGLKTGLAMRTGDSIIYLDRTEPEVEFDLDPNIETTITGSLREVINYYIPGKGEGELVVLNVGTKSDHTNLLAVAHHEETVVKGSLDFIKIYENPFTGKLFDKVSAYKPSSLLSVEFDQGETILAFLEDKRLLQIYEYKGIEGFQPRNSIKVDGASLLFQIDLAQNEKQKTLKNIGIVYKDKIRLIQAVMDGTKIRGDWNCNL